LRLPSDCIQVDKRSLILFSLISLFLTRMDGQELFLGGKDLMFQDSSKYDPMLSHLERTLFPTNSKEESRITYYGCVTPHDSLILYIRKNQPDADSVNFQLKQIAFNKSFENISFLRTLQRGQTYSFQKEWEVGFRQGKEDRCEAFENQLLILIVLDRCIRSLETGLKYSTGQEYFNYLLRLNDSIAIKHLYDYYTDPFIETKIFGLDSQAIQQLFELGKSGFGKYNSNTFWYHDPYLISLFQDRFTRPNREPVYNEKYFDWEYYTPYLDLLKPYFFNYKEETSKLKNKEDLDYWIRAHFFFQTVIHSGL
jgi:hypothetical protein